MHHYFYLILLVLSITSCHQVEQRLSWSDSVLNLGTQGKHPSKNLIDDFFSYTPEQNHPFLSAQFHEEVDKKTHSRLTHGNEVVLLPNADSMAIKLKLIGEAKKNIFVSTFHMICDAGGKEFTKALIRAAKRGVEVRFLITGGPWAWFFAGNCQNRLRKNRVKIATMPYSYITNHGVVQLHDKIFIVDSKIAITGGQNIGSWYAKKDRFDENFRDTDALVAGPVVQDILSRFVTLWKFAKPGDREFQIPPNPPFSKGGEYASWLEQRPLKGLCRFVSQTPSEKEFLVFEAYRLHALETQKRAIFHSLALNASGSAEQENLWKAFLQITHKTEGEVFLLTNGPGFIHSSNIPTWIGRLVGFYFLSSVYDALKGTKITAFAYNTWLHSKVYLFDNLAVGIGSFNFDETGLVWTESTLICLDERLKNQSTAMFRSDLEDSYVITSP